MERRRETLGTRLPPPPRRSSFLGRNEDHPRSQSSSFFFFAPETSNPARKEKIVLADKKMNAQHEFMNGCPEF